MFKVNNKDTRTMLLAIAFYCLLWTGNWRLASTEFITQLKLTPKRTCQKCLVVSTFLMKNEKWSKILFQFIWAGGMECSVSILLNYFPQLTYHFHLFIVNPGIKLVLTCHNAMIKPLVFIFAGHNWNLISFLLLFTFYFFVTKPLQP